MEQSIVDSHISPTLSRTKSKRWQAIRGIVSLGTSKLKLKRQPGRKIKWRKSTSLTGQRRPPIYSMLLSSNHINHWLHRDRISSLTYRNAVGSLLNEGERHRDDILDPNAIISVGIASLNIDRHAGRVNEEQEPSSSISVNYRSIQQFPRLSK